MRILKKEKDYLEIEMNNLTLAEILRVYLWKNKNIIYAGWKREHPSKPPILILKTKKDSIEILKSTIEEIKEEIKEIKKLVK
ncbi:MAG: RpoL/Rpb11 RNA polymerase subunit family protein [Candidatus Pacearchaeota archaeon]